MWKEILEILRTQFAFGPAAVFFEFLSTTKRGIISERRMPPNATLKIKRYEEEKRREETVPFRQAKAAG